MNKRNKKLRIGDIWVIDEECWTCPEDGEKGWQLIGFKGKDLIWEEFKREKREQRRTKE